MKDFDSYLTGLIEDYEKFEYRGDAALSKEEIDPWFNPKNNQELKEKVWDVTEIDHRMQKYIKDWVFFFGLHEYEQHIIEFDKEDLADYLTNRNKEISQLLSKDKQLKEYALSLAENRDIDQRIEPVKASTEELLPEVGGPEFEDLKRKKAAEKIVKTTDMDRLTGGKNFFDLSLDTIKNSSHLKSLAIEPSEENIGIQTYEAQLKKMIELDPPLEKLLTPILAASDSKAESVRKQMKDLFLNLYKQTVDKTLGEEYIRFKTIAPAFTKKAEGIYDKTQKNPEDSKHVEVIDDFLQNNLFFEFHRYIMPHVYFNFAILALNDLESHFGKLAQIINQRERDKKRQERQAEKDGEVIEEEEEVEVEVEGVKEEEEEEEEVTHEETQDQKTARLQELCSLFRLNGVEVRNPAELQRYLQQLNDITRSCAFMYTTNKEKIHFAQDIMLDKYLGFRNDPNRQKTWIRHRSKFMDTVVASVESHRTTFAELLRAGTNTAKFDGEQTPDSVKKLALHNYDDNVDKKHIRVM